MSTMLPSVRESLSERLRGRLTESVSEPDCLYYQFASSRRLLSSFNCSLYIIRFTTSSGFLLHTS